MIGEIFINDIKKMSVGIVVGVTFIFDVFTFIFYSRVCVCVLVAFYFNILNSL